jgi:dienelactone hydrolase
MRDHREPPSPRRFGYVLAGAALTLALLAGGAAPSEGGILLPSSVKKFTSTFDSGGHRITVWRYEPKAKGKYPALVMLYGLECLADSPKRYEFIAERFAAKGYAVHFVHYFDCTRLGAGEAPGVQARVKAALCPVDPGMKPDEQVRKYFRDWMGVIKGAVEYARGQENVDPERVGLLGFSLGGFLTMSLVATEPELKLAAAVECFGGLPRELHPALKSAPPVLIFHGDRDDVVPVREAYSLRALLKERKIHVEEKIFENCGHMFLGDNGALRLDRVLEAERICVRFLDKHLKNGNGAKKSGR